MPDIFRLVGDLVTQNGLEFARESEITVPKPRRQNLRAYCVKVLMLRC